MYLILKDLQTRVVQNYFALAISNGSGICHEEHGITAGTGANSLWQDENGGKVRRKCAWLVGCTPLAGR